MLLQIICRMPTSNVETKEGKIKETFSTERKTCSKSTTSLLYNFKDV